MATGTQYCKEQQTVVQGIIKVYGNLYLTRVEAGKTIPGEEGSEHEPVWAASPAHWLPHLVQARLLPH